MLLLSTLAALHTEVAEVRTYARTHPLVEVRTDTTSEHTHEHARAASNYSDKICNMSHTGQHNPLGHNPQLQVTL
jgi:hypothetical protein